MVSSNFELYFPGLGRTVRIRFIEGNAAFVNAIKESAAFLPTFCVHLGGNEETFQMSLPVTYLGNTEKMPRKLGCLDFDVAKQVVSVCYGETHQKVAVDVFAMVVEEDLTLLKAIGLSVRRMTWAEETHSFFEVTVRIPDVEETTLHGPKNANPESTESWQSANMTLKGHTTLLHQREEPERFKRIRLGYSGEEVGRDGRLPASVYDYARLDITLGRLASFLKDCLNGNYSLETSVERVRSLLIDGLPFDEMKIGEIYDSALNRLETTDNFAELTKSFWSYLAISAFWARFSLCRYLKPLSQPTAEEVNSKPQLPVCSVGDASMLASRERKYAWGK